MAIAAPSMSNDATHDTTQHSHSHSKPKDDDHEHDMVMPGFRFHPTEEELVEFYLRRKVEGKRFNVELITFLDLYRYDPWELPDMAAIGEKEWFFYVPRDRKYRNGDRPNRVTTSGYWKATGADRMIRGENSRSIGLKKTLVFYSGKAPKGIRTSWIMNEYRLPQHETQRYQKTEISLCRVYKRAGVEDHPSLPRCLPTRPSSLRGDSKKYTPSHSDGMARFQSLGGPSQQMEVEKMSETDASSSSTSDVPTALGLSKQTVYRPMASISPTLGLPTVEDQGLLLSQSNNNKQGGCSSLLPNCTSFFAASSSSVSSNVADDLHRLVNYQQQYYNNEHHQEQQPQQHSQFPMLTPQAQQLSLNVLPTSLPGAFSDRLWEWNPIPEANRDYNNLFK